MGTFRLPGGSSCGPGLSLTTAGTLWTYQGQANRFHAVEYRVVPPLPVVVLPIPVQHGKVACGYDAVSPLLSYQ